MFLYRDVFKKSFLITWRNKYLWFFGLFAAFLGGAGSYNLSFFRMSNKWDEGYLASFSYFINEGILKGNAFANLQIIFKQDPIAASIFLVFALIVLALGLFILWLAVVSQVGLISNAVKIIKGGKKNVEVTIKEGIEKGIKNFWPVLAINLVIGIFITVFFTLINIPLVSTAPMSSVWYMLLFVVLVPIALIASFLLIYAVCFIVVKNVGFVDAIVKAWSLFVKNWLVSLEVAFLLFFVDFAFIFVLGFLALVIAVPYLFLAYMLAVAVFEGIFWIMYIAGILFLIVLLVTAGAFLVSFKLVVWTDMFVNLVDKKGGLSKIMRWAGK